MKEQTIPNGTLQFLAQVLADCQTGWTAAWHGGNTTAPEMPLLALIGESQAVAERGNLDDRASLHALIRRFLQEYETSATRHVALLSDTKFLGDEQRTLILSRQRDVVAAFTRFLKRAYPDRLSPANQTAVTKMLFGMINWTFTWLNPNGPLSYEAFADEVIRLLENGLTD